MTDPRETLTRGTLTKLHTTTIKDPLPLFAKTTFTPLDQPRQIVRDGGSYLVDQSPTAEGELVIYYYEEFGWPVAQPFVAVDINGTLEWKTVRLSGTTTSSVTGQPWR